MHRLGDKHSMFQKLDSVHLEGRLYEAGKRHSRTRKYDGSLKSKCGHLGQSSCQYCMLPVLPPSGTGVGEGSGKPHCWRGPRGGQTGMSADLRSLWQNLGQEEHDLSPQERCPASRSFHHQLQFHHYRIFYLAKLELC